jgi:hypothetical protein
VEDLLVGVIAALSVLLGSGLTGFINARAESKRAAREAARAIDQRSYDREERRYNDRLSAYAAFDAVVVKQSRLMDEYIYKQGVSPSEAGEDESDLADVTDALVRVRLLANSPAEQAATKLAETLHGYVWGPVTYDELTAARNRFLTAAREDLGARNAS